MPRSSPILLVVSCLVFCVWVAICAAAPEFMWRGLQEFVDHFSMKTVGWGLLFGAILAFFIEPILERARHHGRFEDERGPVAAAMVAILSALAAVSVHEVLIAIAVSTHGEPTAEAAALQAAVNQILEWSLIPLVVTGAWFVARLGRAPALAAAIVATLWLLGVEWFYTWNTRLAVTTAVPCIVILLAGQVWELRAPGPVRRLAPLMVGIAIVWLAAAWLATQLGWAQLYTPEDLRSDAFFYAGWYLGLVLAPEPLERRRLRSSPLRAGSPPAGIARRSPAPPHPGWAGPGDPLPASPETADALPQAPDRTG
jgi:hypothetical protein